MLNFDLQKSLVFPIFSTVEADLTEKSQTIVVQLCFVHKKHMGREDQKTHRSLNYDKESRKRKRNNTVVETGVSYKKYSQRMQTKSQDFAIKKTMN